VGQRIKALEQRLGQTLVVRENLHGNACGSSDSELWRCGAAYFQRASNANLAPPPDPGASTRCSTITITITTIIGGTPRPPTSVNESANISSGISDALPMQHNVNRVR
jgi:hypothetical protein